MKNTILVLFVMLHAITSNAGTKHSKKEVPADVLQSFSKQYSSKHVKKWRVENDTCIARFTMSRRKCKAYYLVNGDWIKTEIKIPWTKDLPKAVKAGWGKTPYAGGYVNGVKQVISPGKNLYVIAIHYEDGPEGAVSGDWVDDYILYFDAKGALVKKEHFE
jgi:hypothetical protein